MFCRIKCDSNIEAWSALSVCVRVWSVSLFVHICMDHSTESVRSDSINNKSNWSEPFQASKRATCTKTRRMERNTLHWTVGRKYKYVYSNELRSVLTPAEMLAVGNVTQFDMTMLSTYFLYYTLHIKSIRRVGQTSSNFFSSFFFCRFIFMLEYGHLQHGNWFMWFD